MRRRIPATHTLMCFEAAARHGSFTRAAQELSLTQGAVSRQIAQLEALLGQPLFMRGRHGMTLTERGSAYARQVGLRLQALEHDTLQAMAGRGEGSTLHLAAVPTFASRWLIPRLPTLARLQPDLVVHIETRTRPFLFTDTEFDAAIHAGTPEQVANWPGTHARLLLQEVMVPVCAPTLLGRRRRLKPHEVAALPLLQQSTRPRAWREWFDAQGVDAPQAMAGPRYELFSMTVAAASCGMGVALVPRMLIGQELGTGALVEPCASTLHGQRGYYLVTPLNREPSSALARFAPWLMDQAAAFAG